MNTWMRWLRQVHYLINRNAHREALQREMAAHREQLANPRRFGNSLRLREQADAVWGWSLADAWARDVRLAARSLRRSRGYATAVVTSLALGLAFATIIAAVVNAYVIKPLPYPSADRLFHVMYAPPGPYEPAGVAGIDWASLRDVIETPIIARSVTLYHSGAGYSQPARGLEVAPGFLAGLGIRPALGRDFGVGEFAPAAEPVALIGDALWRERFHAAPNVVGMSLRMEAEGRDGSQRTYRIIGVLPSRFWFGRESSATVDVLTALGDRFQAYMVRLRAGVTPERAAARITDVTREISSNLPAEWGGVHLESVRDRYIQSVRAVLNGIQVAALLVLLIVCSNVAVLTLLRSLRRDKELAMRVALGAATRHIVRTLVAETLLLVAASATLAMSLAFVALRFLGPAIEVRLGRPAPGGVDSIRIDLVVLSAVSGAAVVLMLLLALLPLAGPHWRKQPVSRLRIGSRSGTDSAPMQRTRLAFIAAEMALSLVLLVTCGAMLRHMISLLRTDLGFRTEGVVHLSTVVPTREYPDTTRLLALYQRITERVGALTRRPVTFASWPRFAEQPDAPVAVDGATEPSASATFTAVGADFFETFSITIRDGREFVATDLPTSEPVAIVSETMARRLWPTGRAIGHRVRTIMPNTATLSAQWRTVVGVASDMRQTHDDRSFSDIYVPFYQATPGRYAAMYLVSDMPLPQLTAAVGTAIAQTDPTVTIRWLRTVASEDKQLSGIRFLSMLLAVVATFATFLAMVGIYGAIAYAVRQREREIAIRVAIGASGRMVTATFVRIGVATLTVGIGAGAVAVIAVHRFAAAHIAGLPRPDAIVVAYATIALAAAGIAAVWWPARRAAKVNPATVFNAE